MVPAEGARLTVSGYITLLVTIPRVVRRMLLVPATLRRRYGVMALSGVKISELLMVNTTYHTFVVAKFKHQKTRNKQGKNALRNTDTEIHQLLRPPQAPTYEAS